jgi:hypothetical protein
VRLHLGGGRRTARTVIALAVIVLVLLLGLPGTTSAQSALQLHGTIQTVDCDAEALVLGDANGSNTLTAGPYTAVLVNATSVPFCSLDAYIGIEATVWLIPSGNQFTVSQINVAAPVVATPVATPDVSPVPIWGAVLGTIVVAGLVYLLVHAPDGGYYRYPYYGEYYRHYYHPEYRPYRGSYPASTSIITVAPTITGVVLGVTVINNLQFIVSRDNAGHFYRYPYYGPYRQAYYRPVYRPYQGPYVGTAEFRNAPIRQGDPRWDAPRPMVGVPNPPRPAPAYHPTMPALQPAPATIGAPNPPYAPRPQLPPAPVYQPPRPERQPAPSYQPPRQERPPVPAYRPPARPETPDRQPMPQRPPAPSYQPQVPRNLPAPSYQLPPGRPQVPNDHPRGPQPGQPQAPSDRPRAPQPGRPQVSTDHGRGPQPERPQAPNDHSRGPQHPQNRPCGGLGQPPCPNSVGAPAGAPVVT